jgi:uncharacterized protein YndB with AHSA1/START domain
VGLDFLDSAPVRMEFSADIAAPRPDVFRALSADPSTWTWFPGLRSGRYEGTPGLGAIREVDMARTRYRETILAWDEPSRWTYRVDATSAPMARALVEDWVLADRGGRTTVRWIFAIEPSALFRLAQPLARPVMGALFRRAMRNLERTLIATA